MTRKDLIKALVAENNGKKDELITAIEKAMGYGYKEAVEKVEHYLKVNLTPFDYCIGHTEHNEIVMNTERFIEELKKHLGYYGE